jgi:hypothetical protein
MVEGMIDSAGQQAEIEARFAERSRKVHEGSLQENSAFGNIDEWIVRIGPCLWLLVPATAKWMFYNRIHRTWEPTGAGIGEGIFCLYQGVPGMKRIPGPGRRNFG